MIYIFLKQFNSIIQLKFNLFGNPCTISKKVAVTILASEMYRVRSVIILIMIFYQVNFKQSEKSVQRTVRKRVGIVKHTIVFSQA